MKKIFVGIFVAALLLPVGATAQSSVQLGSNPGSQSTASASCGDDAFSKYFCSVSSIPEMLNFAFQAAIRLGAILAMLRIAYAGYLYMGSEDMWSTKSHAKEVFRDAIIGLLVLIAIWLILNQIDPRILKLNILQPSNTSAPAPSGFTNTQTVPTTPL